MAGLELHPNDHIAAAQHASVSASFTIEQFGLPVLTVRADGSEAWNDALPGDRLKELEKRGTTE